MSYPLSAVFSPPGESYISPLSHSSIVAKLADWSGLPWEVAKDYYVGRKDGAATSKLAVSHAIRLFETAKHIRYDDAKTLLRMRVSELTAIGAGRGYIGRLVDEFDPALKEEASKLPEEYWKEWVTRGESCAVKRKVAATAYHCGLPSRPYLLSRSDLDLPSDLKRDLAAKAAARAASAAASPAALAAAKREQMQIQFMRGMVPSDLERKLYESLAPS
jgi:hypothetical protein